MDNHIVSEKDDWIVWSGYVMQKGRGLGSRDRLFQCVAEKLPWDSLSEVSANLRGLGIKREGVYLASQAASETMSRAHGTTVEDLLVAANGWCGFGAGDVRRNKQCIVQKMDRQDFTSM